MPIISMFYGIIIRLYVIDNVHHTLPHLHAKYAEFEASPASRMARFWWASCPASNCGWCKPGLSSTAMNYWPIGSWPAVANSPTRSPRCEVYDGLGCQGGQPALRLSH